MACREDEDINGYKVKKRVCEGAQWLSGRVLD